MDSLARRNSYPSGGSALASLHFHQFQRTVSSISGGIIEDFLIMRALPALNIWGSTIVFSALFLLAITYALNISWLKGLIG